MRSLNIFAVLTTLLIAPTAFAGDQSDRSSSHGKKHPFRYLQMQISALEARTEALEVSASNPSINGRTYCSVLHLQIKRAWPGTQSEETQNNIIRRVVSFENGLLTGDLVSNTLNNHSDEGTISNTTNNPSPDPLLATYLQSGSKVDVTFGNGSTANWHASRDGSLIFGAAISSQVFAGGAVSVGFMRTWTLVEIGPLDSCDAEDQ